MAKQIYNLHNGYTIDEVEELAGGRLVKLTIQEHKPAENSHVVRSPRILPRVVLVVTLAAAATLALTMCGKAAVNADAPAVEPETAEPLPVVDTAPETDDKPDHNEDELIDAALVEQGYFRDDVPLTYEEQDYLHTAAEEFGVDYHLMLGLIERETNFRNIPGDGGDSAGFCQVQEKWWRGLMEEIGADDLTEPYDNFRTACAIMARHLERYGSTEAALVAYNQGHFNGHVTNYAIVVMANAEKWRDG